MPSISLEADQSLRFKIPAKPKTSAPTLQGEGASLPLAATSVLDSIKEETLEPFEGDEFFSLCSYVRHVHLHR